MHPRITHTIATYFVIISTLFIGNVWAQEKCDFGNVKQEANGNYTVCEPYFKLLDRDTRLVEEYKAREGLFTQKIKMQEDLFKVSEQQVEIWKDTANGLNDQLNKRSWWDSLSPYFYFAAGIGLTLGAAWTVHQVVK